MIYRFSWHASRAGRTYKVFDFKSTFDRYLISRCVSDVTMIAFLLILPQEFMEPMLWPTFSLTMSAAWSSIGSAGCPSGAVGPPYILGPYHRRTSLAGVLLLR